MCYFVSQWKTNSSKHAKPLHLLLATIKTKTAPKKYTQLHTRTKSIKNG